MPTYTASSELFANPERGFFQYAPDSRVSNFKPLVQSDLVNARVNGTTINGFTFPAQSLVFRYYFLDEFVEQDTISATYLAQLDQDFATVRAAGVKIMPRFAYTNTTGYDATPARVLLHIDQLAPTVNKYADVIHALQAGFIGRWGEWYYSDHFGDSGNVSSTDIANRNAVIARLLAKLDPRIFVLLRYAGSRQTYFGTTAPNPGGDATRVGMHNDAFLAPYGDYGTYTTFSSLSETQNRTYVEQLANVPNGGESANYAEPDSQWPNAQAMLSSKHFSFLNPNYFPQTISSWGQGNLDTATRTLGHRLRLVAAMIPATAAVGSPTTVNLTIANDGWAAPVRNRPSVLVLDDGKGNVSKIPLGVDIRTIGPGQQVAANVSFTPSTAGTFSTFLQFPDASSAIADRTEYMLRLANTGMWDAATGRNALSSPIVVGSSTGNPGGGTGPTPTSVKSIIKLKVAGTFRTVKLNK